MYNSKKAQISDTLSWVVATIIIIMLLLITMLLVGVFNLVKKPDTEKVLFYHLQDPIATKSISGYLFKNYNSMIKKEIIREKVSASNIDALVYPFLLSLNRSKVEGWNLIITLDGKEIYQKDTYRVVGKSRVGGDKFYFYESGKEIVLEFWMEGQMYA